MAQKTDIGESVHIAESIITHFEIQGPIMETTLMMHFHLVLFSIVPWPKDGPQMHNWE